MEFFRIRRDIPFMRHALVFNVISLLTFVAAVFFLCTAGLHLSVEFTGGTVMEVQLSAGRPTRTGARDGGEARLSPTCRCRTSAPSRDVLIRLPRKQGRDAPRSKATR